MILATVAPGSTARMLAAANDLPQALTFARAAIEAGRKDADPRRYGQAQATLAPWWDEAMPPAEVRVLRAIILQAFHDFPAALRDLDAVLAASPTHIQARASRAFVNMVIGNLDFAAKDCIALPARIGLALREACKARVEALSGQSSKAAARLAAALATDRRSPPAMVRFATGVLAEIAAGGGDPEHAAKLYAHIADDGEADVATLAAYADVLIDLGRPAEVFKILEPHQDTDIALLRLAIAARLVDDPRLLSWSTVLDERFAAAAATGNRVHRREEAMYALRVKRDFGRAAELAGENWLSQKEPLDARLLLASAIAAMKPEAAYPVVDFVQRVKLSDARIAPLLHRVKASIQ